MSVDHLSTKRSCRNGNRGRRLFAWFLIFQTMSKPISISFGKSKSSTFAPATTSQHTRPLIPFAGKPKSRAPRNDSDDEDEITPQHESITAFAANGAILTEPEHHKEDLVIKNAGNGDWRKRGRGRNLLPAEVQAQQNAENNGEVVIVERDEVSKASGLQLAEPSRKDADVPCGPSSNGHLLEPVKELTEDERALQALLSDGTGERKSHAVIEISENSRAQPRDETDDFRADVASRPNSCTLDEYAAMPVEEFGMAMLRGMGQKRRANGEIISYGSKDAQTNGTAPKIREPRQGYLGIGAKAAPGAEVELGAWGKTAMRKNQRGEGFYTPVMLKDKRTGEMLTEEELERRKKEAKEKAGRNESATGELDWRERRDRNLERSGRDRDREGRNTEQRLLTDQDRERMNGISRNSSSGRDIDREGGDYRNEKSRRDRDRDRSPSHSKERDRRRRDDDERHREWRRDKYKDDERYDSNSSRKSSHRERDRDRDRYDRDDDRRRKER
jgi:G-patch domain